MKENDFFSCFPLEQLLVDYKAAQEIQWSNFQRIIYDGLSFKAVNYDNNETRTISIPIKCTPNVYSQAKLKYLCPNGCPISKSKYDDLQSLLDDVPPEYHNFYQSLNYVSDNPINDYGLVFRIFSDEEKNML